MDGDLVGYSFDLARGSTGWVKWDGERPVKSGTINLPSGLLGAQGAEFQTQMSIMLRNEPIVHWVAFEDARAVSKQHGMILFGLTMILHVYCYHHGIPVIGFAQTTVKKALTGNGRATKMEMVGAAQQRWPELAVISDDEADALGVGLSFIATQ